VFDPERDWDPGVRPFYLRLLAVGFVTAALGAALWPSVSGFAAGPNHDVGCVAIRDGWHSDVSAPSAADLSSVQSVFPPPPTPAQVHDPQFMARWRAQMRVAEANPATMRANAAIDWLSGPGACVPESRHRLGLSAAALACVLLVTLGPWLALRSRSRTRNHAVFVS
jgi:hypothetical protein